MSDNPYLPPGTKNQISVDELLPDDNQTSWQEERLAYAITSAICTQFNPRAGSSLSPELRKQYFIIFSAISEPGTVTVEPRPNFRQPYVFNGVSFTGARNKLSYGQDAKFVSLEISDYSFGGKEVPTIQEIGFFETSVDDGGNLESKFLVGPTFKVNRGYTANHTISQAMQHFSHVSALGRFAQEMEEAYRRGVRITMRDVLKRYDGSPLDESPSSQ